MRIRTILFGTMLMGASYPASLSAQDSDPQRHAVCFDDRSDPRTLTKIFTLRESQTHNLDTRVTRFRYGDWKRLESDRADATFAECSISDTREDVEIGFEIQHDLFMQATKPFQVTDYRFEAAPLSSAAVAAQSRAQREAAWQRKVEEYRTALRENMRLEEEYRADHREYEREIEELDDLHRDGRERQADYEKRRAEYERKKAENDAQKAAYEAQMREYRRTVSGE